MTTPPSVLVLGGGPAGATSAAVLARHGAQVNLFEKSRFPRHHVGESLQPATFRLLDQHLGIGGRFADAGFARKYGAVYVWGESREPWSVLFDDRLERDLDGLDEAGLLAGDYEHAWQVDRATFDHMLLQAARDEGAQVTERAEATQILQEGGRVVGAEVRLPDGSTEEVRADFVLDCTGQRCLVGRALGQTRLVSDLQATATYGYYDGAGGVPGPLGRHVQVVVSTPEGWAWFIPTSPTRTSVGVVCNSREKLTRARFEEIVAAADLPIAGGTPVEGERGPLRFSRDWSFTHKRFAGPGWFLVGDAACFVDPILSGGVDFAVREGCAVALAVLQAHDAAGPSAGEVVARYDQRLRAEYRAYLKLARYWYGNNRSVDGLFWTAHESVHATNVATPMRAFVYLTPGHYAADRHFKVFARWQEEKMFRALGVDADALKAARADRS
jgi:halogenation protein CepH